MKHPKTVSPKTNPNRVSNQKILPFVLWTIFWISILVFISIIPAIQDALISMTTHVTNSLLHGIGLRTLVQDNRIALLGGTEMKFSIVPDCTGIYPLIILTSLMLSFPSSIQKRIRGIGGALVMTFTVNHLRLVALIAIGYKNQEWFRYAHIFFFQITYILLIVLYFLWWLQWNSTKKKK